MINLVDLSLSTKYYCSWDSSLVANLYYTVARDGGGNIKVFSIGSNSLLQSGISETVPNFDTITPKGNLFQVGKARSLNKKRNDSFDTNACKCINSLIKSICVKRTELFSDIGGALLLAKQTAEQSNYKEYRTFVIINSDMLQDLPRSRKEKLTQVYQFPDNTKVLIIRPALSQQNLRHLFGNTPFEIYTSINDAITTISSR